MNIDHITACVYLDDLGRYAKHPDYVKTVRLYTGTGCDHIDITKAEYLLLTREQRVHLEGLGGRPECIDTTGKSNG